MPKEKILTIVQVNQMECKICMNKILEFLRLCKYDTDTDQYMTKGFNTKQISLYQFQARIGKGLEILDTNNNKGRKKHR